MLGGAVLKKVDAEDPTAVLSGATFKLEQLLADGTWGTVPVSYTHLVYCVSSP